VSADIVCGVGMGVSLDMNDIMNEPRIRCGGTILFILPNKYYLVLDVEGFRFKYNPLHFGLQKVRDVNTPKQS
jgi:hypothetical protein